MGSVIRAAAILMSAFVLLGFGFFAVDEMDRGSQNQQNALANELDSKHEEVAPIAPAPRDEVIREERNSTFREMVDDVNDVLLNPFTDLVDSTNTWVSHGVPALLGLLLYGFGLGFLANLLPRERHHTGDWRTAES